MTGRSFFTLAIYQEGGIWPRDGQYAYEKGDVLTLGSAGVFQSRFSCQFGGEEFFLVCSPTKLGYIVQHKCKFSIKLWAIFRLFFAFWLAI